jgi:hypothetical protein
LNIPLGFDMPKPSGMFGGGKFGLKEAIAAGLAGFVSRKNPMALQGLMQALMLRQKQKQDEYNYNRERQDKRADFTFEQDYKAAHPELRAPHYFESNSGDQYAIGPDGQPVEVFHDPMRFKFIPNGMGGVVPVNIESLMGGGAKPLTDEDIDRMSGGQTPPASGSFRY